MSDRRPDFVAAFGQRFAFPLFLLVFGLFCANVLAGKLFILLDWNRAWLAGDLAEFLLLAVSALLLMLAALARERSSTIESMPDGQNREQ